MPVVEASAQQKSLEQMDALFQESQTYFLGRNLKKALNTAQIALDFAKESKSEKEVLQASILLATIYNANGRYLGDPSFFMKALIYLDEIGELVVKAEAEIQVEYLKTKGEILQNRGEYAAAKATFSAAWAKVEKPSKQEILLFCGLSQLELLQSNYNEALNYVQKALEILSNHAELEKDKKLFVEVCHQLSQVSLKKNDFSGALEFSQTALALSRELKDVEKEIGALNTIAIVSGIKSNYKIAMQYFQEALAKSEAIGFRHNIAHCLINIGTIYAHLFNYEDARERYNLVLENYRDTLDDYTKVAIFNNVGNINYTTGNFAEAMEYFEKALHLAKARNLKEEMGLALAQISRTHTALHQLAEAETFAKQATKIITPLGNVNGNQINLINLSDICFQKGDFEKALTWVEEGIEAARGLHDDANEIKGIGLLAAIFQKKGKYKKAFELLSEYTRKQEEFARVQRSKQFMDLEIKGALKEKQKEIEQLTKENEYQALLLEKSDQIERQNSELLQMNEDLRQFAYVASHDLKEPLRMVGSYAQIFQRLYENNLDDNARTYLGYMVEGVGRMNNLLDALLKYATIGRSDEEFEEVDLGYAIEVCKVNLSVLIKETGAAILYENLPKIITGKSLLVQLLQNLLSNAIKFRKPDVAPVIEISAEEMNHEYIISVRDNGIGIAQDHKERIFVIFQRLHPRTKYEGTGIGLAICMKIVQRLGGRIWVESEEGIGSTFKFTVPKV